ncbi:uncharacterized protein LOC131003838 isoform X1 [Salvia miltiorrhiza]|uniref:uncharacterized protein LOC131003838 isoform X1 n=1 Tax=Salvia miltiorrhiza TaxID=226208 RepID=UPI0025AD2B1D|nr:uncharacterized protein LOC131003838 isoform X1 [Salvia miltiorrhiza]
MAQIRDVLHPWLQQIWEVLHPWLHPTLQIHDSRLFLYKWALEIAERGKSCRSFFVLGARTVLGIGMLELLFLMVLKKKIPEHHRLIPLMRLVSKRMIEPWKGFKIVISLSS